MSRDYSSLIIALNPIHKSSKRRYQPPWYSSATLEVPYITYWRDASRPTRTLSMTRIGSNSVEGGLYSAASGGDASSVKEDIGECIASRFIQQLTRQILTDDLPANIVSVD